MRNSPAVRPAGPARAHIARGSPRPRRSRWPWCVSSREKPAASRDGGRSGDDASGCLRARCAGRGAASRRAREGRRRDDGRSAAGCARSRSVQAVVETPPLGSACRGCSTDPERGSLSVPQRRFTPLPRPRQLLPAEPEPKIAALQIRLRHRSRPAPAARPLRCVAPPAPPPSAEALAAATEIATLGGPEVVVAQPAASKALSRAEDSREAGSRGKRPPRRRLPRRSVRAERGQAAAQPERTAGG